MMAQRRPMPPDGGYFCLRGVAAPGFEPVDLDLARGECVAIMGASGAGKSLCLRQLADLDPGAGEIWLDGTARSALSGPAWRRRVVYCQAEAGWWDDAVAAHFPDRQALAPLMQALGLRAGLLQAQVHELSTGERQRLGLARALLLQSPVLLLDEPTAALDEVATGQVEHLLRERQRAGAVLVMVTHNAAQAERLAARQFRVQDRRLVAL
ncbi:ABC transporter ATP-binding protein [Bordetella trematum]|uniref:ABC transporter ATP-binding protein n=2 Tax=Bordetella trematum TaxID=123899 RepID=UPI000D906C0F|nr:ATP-binding cassette domain-containing protein [Bordetella trematum]SPU51086.1 amino acid ABC transporter ATP-binding protein [Bordetella trematum]VDH07349.1 Uncharacterized ABC transporter ATP-binding protein YbbL [Bordetella trematum]